MYEDITEEIEMENLSRMSLSSLDTIDWASIADLEFESYISGLIKEIEKDLGVLEDAKVEEIISSYKEIESKVEKKSFFERFCFCLD